MSRYGGHVILADYCPYNQELAYKNSNRDSRCYRASNQPLRMYMTRTNHPCSMMVMCSRFLANENYALERYSSQSKCFDHGSFWEQYIDHCRRKRRVIPQAAGCYQVFPTSFSFVSSFRFSSSSMNVFHPKECTSTSEKKNISVNILVKI